MATVVNFAAVHVEHVPAREELFPVILLVDAKKKRVAIPLSQISSVETNGKTITIDTTGNRVYVVKTETEDANSVLSTIFFSIEGDEPQDD